MFDRPSRRDHSSIFRLFIGIVVLGVAFGLFAGWVDPDRYILGALFALLVIGLVLDH